MEIRKKKIVDAKTYIRAISPINMFILSYIIHGDPFNTRTGGHITQKELVQKSCMLFKKRFFSSELKKQGVNRRLWGDERCSSMIDVGLIDATEKIGKDLILKPNFELIYKTVFESCFSVPLIRHDEEHGWTLLSSIDIEHPLNSYTWTDEKTKNVNEFTEKWFRNKIIQTLFLHPALILQLDISNEYKLFSLLNCPTDHFMIKLFYENEGLKPTYKHAIAKNVRDIITKHHDNIVSNEFIDIDGDSDEISSVSFYPSFTLNNSFFSLLETKIIDIYKQKKMSLSDLYIGDCLKVFREFPDETRRTLVDMYAKNKADGYRSSLKESISKLW